MVINFSDLSWKERPILLLKNLDGTVIQPLRYAHGITGRFNYNETSELNFTVPRYVDGEETPSYHKIVGMRIIDFVGVGQFILINPKTTSNGGKDEKKECRAYSLEHELTTKKSYVEEGTYELYNPLAPDSTILGILLSDFPSWSVGQFDASLIGKYRTFDPGDVSPYELMKNTLQESYQCIFDFDTYNRKVNVQAIESDAALKQVYLSQENLLKKIEVEEDTENIFTAIDVNGAEDVDIRSVNPMGTNVIYNLDYFMNTDYFSQEFIDKWSNWKTTYESYRKPYYDLTVSKVLQEARLETERAALIEMQGVLSGYEAQQSVYVELAASGADVSSNLTAINTSITSQKAKIATQSELVSDIQDAVDALYLQQRAINEDCSWSEFFTNDELKLLSRYVKQDSISEDSFVYQTVNSFSIPDTSLGVNTAAFTISGAQVNGATRTSGAKVYVVFDGTLSVNLNDSATSTITADIVSAALEVASNKDYIFTAYLNKGSYGGQAFPSGTISICGKNMTTIDTDATTNGLTTGAYLNASTSNNGASNLYFTQNATEYSKRSVEWDLYDYGQQQLEELAWPSYSFSIDSANFLALDGFELFKNQLALGDKIYLDMGDRVLTPIVVGVEVDFDDPTKFKLEFGDTYSLKDSAFQLVDLLKESINMGKTTASNRKTYSAFIDSGAATAVEQFINNALDASKNAVLSGANEEIKIDGSGIRLRSWDSSTSSFDPEQIWMIHNNIVFTDDNWESAKMAIGHIQDQNLVSSTNLQGDAWGIVAQQIVGTMLAGQNLIIESAKKDGETAVFRVDADGAKLYNSEFDIVNEYTQSGTNAKGWITMYAPLGIVSGVDTTGSPLYHYTNGTRDGVLTESGQNMADLSSLSSSDLPRASFWVDMKGNAYLKGKVFADSGQFTGTIRAQDVLLPNGSGGYESILNSAKTRIDGVKIANGTITAAQIDAETITAAEIAGNTITAEKMNTNQLKFTVKSGSNTAGYMGYATGQGINTSNQYFTTYGVALSNYSGALNYNTTGVNYLIVTMDGGVRMHSSTSSTARTDLYVIPGGAFYNGDLIFAGSYSTSSPSGTGREGEVHFKLLEQIT